MYLYPYAEDQNAGYILIDLDQADPAVLSAMRANGHEPCVVLQTSPGNWQAWVHVSSTPLPPALATAVGRYLAQLYGGDRASTDWRHLGRLAGFTNQKPQRRHSHGYPPWVKVIHTAAGLASHADGLLQAAGEEAATANTEPHSSTCSAAGQRTVPVSRRRGRFTNRGCGAGTLHNALHSRTGASWICGWRALCWGKAYLPLTSNKFCGWAVRVFRAAMATPPIICAAHWLALPPFPPQCALCVPLIH